VVHETIHEDAIDKIGLFKLEEGGNRFWINFFSFLHYFNLLFLGWIMFSLSCDVKFLLFVGDLEVMENLWSKIAISKP
jgi:hypothetical protein